MGQKMQSYLQVFKSLRKIRDERLYRETHRTFDEYVRDKFGSESLRLFKIEDARHGG